MSEHTMQRLTLTGDVRRTGQLDALRQAIDRSKECLVALTLRWVSPNISGFLGTAMSPFRNLQTLNINNHSPPNEHAVRQLSANCPLLESLSLHIRPLELL